MKLRFNLERMGKIVFKKSFSTFAKNADKAQMLRV
jgi:hypothetical protein